MYVLILSLLINGIEPFLLILLLWPNIRKKYYFNHNREIEDQQSLKWNLYGKNKERQFEGLPEITPAAVNFQKSRFTSPLSKD